MLGIVYPSELGPRALQMQWQRGSWDPVGIGGAWIPRRLNGLKLSLRILLLLFGRFGPSELGGTEGEIVSD